MGLFSSTLAFLRGPTKTSRLPACLAFTLPEEGGFSDNPKDPGGATYKGVTLATFRVFKGDPTLTVQDLLAITDADLQALYGSMFWNVVRGDDLAPGLDLMVFDFAVNAGPSRSAMILQRLVGAKADGHIGNVTLAAVRKAPVGNLIRTIANQQADYYRSLADFDEFGKGWIDRVNKREAAAFQATVA